MAFSNTNFLHSQFRFIRDCLDGEDAIKAGGQTYVPKPDGMTTANYTHYLDRACYYGAPAMTLQALVGLALRKDPVQMPLPIRMSTKVLNPFSSDLRGEHRTKTVPPEPHRFMADIDATFMQQVLDIAQ